MHTQNLLTKYTGYRRMVEKKANPSPRRIIFYRDGVSEGQFKTVLETEVPHLKGIALIHMCAALANFVI